MWIWQMVVGSTEFRVRPLVAAGWIATITYRRGFKANDAGYVVIGIEPPGATGPPAGWSGAMARAIAPDRRAGTSVKSWATRPNVTASRCLVRPHDGYKGSVKRMATVGHLVIRTHDEGRRATTNKEMARMYIGLGTLIIIIVIILLVT